MKARHFFLSLLLLLVAVVNVDAARRDPLKIEKMPTVAEPYAEFSFMVGDLKGYDDNWREGPTLTIKKSGYPDFSFSPGEFHKYDDDKVASKSINRWIDDSNNNWKIYLDRIYALDPDDKNYYLAVFRVYCRKDPLSQFSVKLKGKYGKTSGDDKEDNVDVSRADQYQWNILNGLQSKSYDRLMYYTWDNEACYSIHFDNSGYDRNIVIDGNNYTGEQKFTSSHASDNKFKFRVTYSDDMFTRDVNYTVSETVVLGPYTTYTFPKYTLTTHKYAEASPLTVSPDQWTKTVSLSWELANRKSYKVLEDNKGEWYLYRKRKNETTYKKVTTRPVVTTSGRVNYIDRDETLAFETDYEYKVCFWPYTMMSSKGMGGKGDPESSPMERTSKSSVTSIVRKSPFVNIETKPYATSIVVKWNFMSVPRSGYKGVTPMFTVQRRLSAKDPFTDLKGATNIAVKSNTSTTDSIVDTDIKTSCQTYQYRVMMMRGDTTYYCTNNSWVKATSSSKLLGVTASKGAFNDHTILTWTAYQVGTEPTKFQIERRDVSSKEWSILNVTTGTAAEYSYTDATCKSGHYYEYKVTAYTLCDGQYTPVNSMTTIGFAQSLGTMTGQVTFGSGTAVDSVTVGLIPNSGTEGEHKPFYYSAKVGKTGNGLSAKVGSGEGYLNKDVFDGKTPYSVALWVKPDTANCVLVTLKGKDGSKAAVENDLFMKNGTLYFYNSGSATSTNLSIPVGRWSYVFMTHDPRNKVVTVGYIDEDGKIKKNQMGGVSFVFSQVESVHIGNQANDPKASGCAGGTGYFDEVRLYSISLSDNDILRSYDRMLSGEEKGLKLYWPMNETTDTHYLFDFSRTNGVTNGAHGTMNGGSNFDTDTPNATGQLSFYGLTGADGTYSITGIPYVGNGTNYTVVPSKGTHEFTMQKQTRFVSSSSLVHSGVDFTDQSSFEVHGTIRYAGTTIPVEGCTFEVDGVACIDREKNFVQSGPDGTYTISVPIGDHYITVKKSGHTFAEGGRYPAGAGTNSFLKEVYNLDFEDNTLVNFTGRVVGGFRDRDLPVGFAKSDNNIGIAELVLVPADDRYLMNAVKTTSGTTYSYKENPEKVDVKSDTTTINSRSYRGGGSAAECKKIYIRTDSITGEFSAMVPPVKYILNEPVLAYNKSVTICGKQDIDLSSMKYQADTLFTDSARRVVGGIYRYAAKFVPDYHTTPIFKVTDIAFGVKDYEGYDSEGDYKVKDIYTIAADNAVTYRYGYPIFVTGSEYDFSLEAYEKYVNKDSGREIIDQQPLSGCQVQISNQLSSTQRIVTTAGTDLDGTAYNEGDAYGTDGSGVQLGKDGRAVYKWWAGLPNLNEQSNYARSITMNLFVSGKAYPWVPEANSGLKRPDGTATGPGMMGINLGAISLGKDFVTAGPDQVLMVLRDPPGAKSSATWKKGSTHTHTKDRMRGGGLHSKDVVILALGAHTEVITGTGGFALAAVNTVVERQDDLGVGFEFTAGRYTGKTDSYTISATEDISTSGDPDFVGSWGDIYIGTGTNYIYGKAREIYLPRTGSSIGKREVESMRDSLSTAFRYSQLHVLETLIPKYKDGIKNVLEPWPASGTLPDTVKAPHYYTKLAKNDSRYGSSNYDKSVWGNEAKTEVKGNKVLGPSYSLVFPKGWVGQDTIQYMHNQITAWQNVIKKNEQEKVEMFEERESANVVCENISFDGGAKDSREYSSSSSVSKSTRVEGEENIHFILSGGRTIVGVGLKLDNSQNSITKQEDTTSDSDETTTSFSFSLSDNDYSSHTMDVYRAYDIEKKEQKATSKNGWGPIFRTRAGQTYGPYEDGDSTRFFQKGTEINAKTLQMDNPHIEVTNATMNNIPNGGTARFEVVMNNQSSSNTNFMFTMGYDTGTNPNNANIAMDGVSLLNGVKFYIPYNTTVKKTITLTQTDKSKLDYDNIKLYLRSVNQNDPTSHWPVIQSTAVISARFVPVSTDVMLAADKQVINTSNSKVMTFTISDFDANHEGLKSIKLQYRYANSPDWITLHSWVTETPKDNSEESLTNAIKQYAGTPKFVLDMNGYSDGTYQFRALSATMFGTETEVTKESETLMLTKDTTKPTLMYMPEPFDGILGLNSELSVEFNKDIAWGKLTKDANFELYGRLTDVDRTIHSVGAQCTESGDVIMTKDKLDMRNRPFTLEFWSRNVEGNIINIGTDQTMTILGYEDGTPYVYIGSKDTIGTHLSYAGKPIGDIKDKWVFWQLTYQPSQKEDGKNLLSLTAAYDDQRRDVIEKQEVNAIISNGKMALGAYNDGRFADIAIWNYARSWEEGALSMNKRKTGLEDRLAHYWKLDEGQGTKAQDLVGGNDILMPENGWFFSGVNFSAHVKKDSMLVVPFVDSNIDDNDSYAVEFWYSKSMEYKDSLNQNLFYDAEGGLAMGLSTDGHVVLKTKREGVENTYTSQGTFNDGWHHVVLNVQRGISAIVYVDGTNQMMLQEKSVPTIAGQNIYFGGQFDGDFDEIKVWKGTMSKQLLCDERFNKTDTATVDGLVRYYPFENTKLDSGNQPVTVFSLHNAAEPNGVTKHDMTGNASKGQTTPPLKQASQLTNIMYDFTASDRKVSIKIPESVLSKLEGTSVNVILKNVPDLNGNLSNTISWSTFVRMNPLKWMSSDDCEVEAYVGEQMTFEEEIYNIGGSTANWSLNLPSWITAYPLSGSLAPLSKQTITFVVSGDIDAGKKEVFMELMNVNNKISEKRRLILNVNGSMPLWTVNKVDKEYSIPMTAQFVVDGSISEEESDIVGAFVGEECIGVSNVQYTPSRNAYYVSMTLYGGEKELDKTITYKAWDSSKDIVYAPLVNKGRTKTFTPSAKPFGTYDEPYILMAGETVEQTVDIQPGWNWISFYVKSDYEDLNEALGHTGGKMPVIKTQNKSALWSNDTEYEGQDVGYVGSSLKTLNEQSMYAIKATDYLQFTVQGRLLIGSQAKKTITTGWNWIRNPFAHNQSITSALSGFTPGNGDAIQARDSYTMWSANYNRWEGTVSNFMPGVGYKYYSSSDASKTLFEELTGVKGRKSMVMVAAGEEIENSYYGYAENMTLLATLKLIDNVDVDKDTVRVRTTNSLSQSYEELPDRGYYVITISGPDDAIFSFDAFINGSYRKLYAVAENASNGLSETLVTYLPDAVIGTFDSPIILTDNPSITDIEELTADGFDADGDYEVYSLMGYKVLSGKHNADELRSLPSGIYIINGKKVSLSR